MGCDPPPALTKIHVASGNFLAEWRAGRHVAEVLGLALVLTFASWLTVHLGITIELLRTHPRWRAALCLLPPLSPLAAYWALRQGMHRLLALWGGSAVAHLVLVYVAYR